MNWKDILERAAWTFVEGFLVALPATLKLGMDKGEAALTTALLSACAAGVSAVKTMVIEYIRQMRAKSKQDT